ncbi:hydrogenase maturation protease [Candidatus Methylacidiphilum fumarolicum]|uniref:Hydrogenase maturation protease n=3 Tax=Candidatus Methylacidiphilum fumarolicum TaxID=591154 RepID=A0ABN8XGA2_9BACT|nr:hydrogenase maturation protease [Candidatus Methylacidiphilum fumarolicum]MBW6414602.1 hydrogenase maturation protease [Candidatus Methylacidiphilum fumarolicum]TFE70884.1 hydrogenase maturation protease [Candidatus Methylacidiphilum fumarolicum]TFE71855.1 hydrogenase maturation protease [Candidatus Methylacidiphilum fumarolicum]TFE75149.1 hydrogenase maturation protease [Candidatus Methylacidiphilum fumarolicum]TFE77395.1 hydrogenase maturation protease [Candidatus Methylacidiphilum fumaro
MAIAIIGCGQLLRKDDGLGPELIRRLASLHPPLPVKLIDYGTSGFSLLDDLEEYDSLIVIDGLMSGSTPGTIFMVGGEQLEKLLETGPYADLHSFRWDDALKWGKWLYKERFPKNIKIYLVEVKEVGYGIGLSEPVKEAIERLVEMFKKEFSSGENEIS